VVTPTGRAALEASEATMAAAIREVLDLAHDRDTLLDQLLALDDALSALYMQRIAARARA
jgi:hypothetical protein